jgi:hypothetical protein
MVAVEVEPQVYIILLDYMQHCQARGRGTALMELQALMHGVLLELVAWAVLAGLQICFLALG